jgi:hypothetical protein
MLRVNLQSRFDRPGEFIQNLIGLSLDDTMTESSQFPENIHTCHKGQHGPVAFLP